jgi:maltose/moltooligosaccharide transporter
MLFAILIAKFLWFMADNAIGTYIGNYVIYYLDKSSSITSTLIIVGGVASVLGFAIAGAIADHIGRKWTISIGLTISVIALFMMCFVKENLFWILYIVWIAKGFGMSLVHNCSFPMVVELCTNQKIGKFTGFYYAASMSAQTITPILLGFIFMETEKWQALPIYSCILLLASCVLFTCLVKNIKAKKIKNVKGLEALGGDD